MNSIQMFRSDSDSELECFETIKSTQCIGRRNKVKILTLNPRSLKRKCHRKQLVNITADDILISDSSNDENNSFTVNENHYDSPKLIRSTEKMKKRMIPQKANKAIKLNPERYEISDDDENVNETQNVQCNRAFDSSEAIKNDFNKTCNTSIKLTQNKQTELDLLVRVIKDDISIPKVKPPIKYRCKPNGILQQLHKIIDASDSERLFLQHDKRLGLRVSELSGRIVKIHKSFGLVIIYFDDVNNQRHSVIVSSEILAKNNFIIGKWIDTYFDGQVYNIECEGNVYLQSNKILPA